MALLSIQNIGKTFAVARGGVAGLHRLDLEVEHGELISLLGPSGCGKTTTLRCIAGLETPDHGTIELDGKILFSSEPSATRRAVNVPPERRGMAMVFQDYALWPHMDVFKNVAFGLQGTRLSRSDISSKVERALRNVRLWDSRDRRISQLSGGQQQRVALARAMAPNPKVILFDEPLSNMDTQLREDMRLEVLELQEKMGLTSIWVTHDQDEALGISSRIVLINAGRVEQIGTPTELWKKPATEFTAGFIGTTNRLTGTVANERTSSDGDGDGDGDGLMLLVDGKLPVLLPNGTGLTPGERASIYVRAAALSLADGPSAALSNVWRVPLEMQTFHGDYTVLLVRFGGMRLSVRSDEFLEIPPDHLYLHIDPTDIMVFRENG